MIDSVIWFIFNKRGRGPTLDSFRSLMESYIVKWINDKETVMSGGYEIISVCPVCQWQKRRFQNHKNIDFVCYNRYRWMALKLTE